MILKIKKYNSNKELRVGDFVRILSEYLPGTGENDYRGDFIDDMLGEYGGKILKITRKESGSKSKRWGKLEDDGFDYILDDSYEYLWTSRMFNKITVL